MLVVFCIKGMEQIAPTEGDMTAIFDLNLVQDLNDDDIIPIGTTGKSTRGVTAKDAAKYFTSEIGPIVDEAKQAALDSQQSAESAEESAAEATAAAGVVGPQVREALRRSYAEAGYNLIGRFSNTGLAVASITDVVLWESTGVAYAYSGTLPHTIGAGETPIGNPLWVDKSHAEISFLQEGTDAVPRTAEDKMREIITPHDFSSPEAMIAAAIGRARTAAVFNSYFAFTITAGAGGNYPTLLEALIAAQAMRPFYDDGQAFCEVKLKTGYVLNTQIAFGAGVDLSWIKITSEDAVVFADTTSFMVSVRTYYVNKYLFYFKGKSSSPVFAIQIEENREDSDVTAFLAAEGAELLFAPYSGARKFYVGIDAYLGCNVIGLHNGSATDPGAIAANLPAGYYLCDFSYSRFTAVRLLDGVRANLPVSKFEHCQEATQQAVLCIYGVTANFHGSSASYSAGSGWNIRDNCQVTIRDHKTIRCGGTGIASIHGASINARCHHTEESARATSGQVLDPLVEKGLYGCAVGVRCESAAIVELAGNDIRMCGLGVNTATGATVTGKACYLSDCTLAFEGYASATQSFPRLWAKNVGKLVEHHYASNFSSWTAHVSMNPASLQTRFVDTRDGGRCNFYDADIDANTGLMAQDGSELSISSSTLKINAVRSFYGSRVHLDLITWNQEYKNATPQLNISRGSFLNAQTITTSDSVVLTSGLPKNTLSISGAVFAA